MPPKAKKAAAPKRTAADVEAEFRPQLESALHSFEHLRWEAERIAAVTRALEVDLSIARDRAAKEGGRLEAIREVHTEKKTADEAAHRAVNAQCEGLSEAARIKRQRIMMLSEERAELQVQLDALHASESGDVWEREDIVAAQHEIERLVAEVAESQRRSQRYHRAAEVVAEVDGSVPTSAYYPSSSSQLPPTHRHQAPLHLIHFAPTQAGQPTKGPTRPLNKLVQTLVGSCGFVLENASSSEDLSGRGDAVNAIGAH